MSHNSSSSDHEKSRNLRSLQAVASVILWKLCIREHGSVSLCRDGQKTKWRLQCKY